MNWWIYKSCRASLNSLKRSLLPLHPLYNVTLYTFLSPSILNLIWAVPISANRSLSILFSSIIHSLVFFLAPRLSADSHYIFRAIISPLTLMRLSNRYNFNRVRFIHSVLFSLKCYILYMCPLAHWNTTFEIQSFYFTLFFH